MSFVEGGMIHENPEGLDRLNDGDVIAWGVGAGLVVVIILLVAGLC